MDEQMIAAPVETVAEDAPADQLLAALRHIIVVGACDIVWHHHQDAIIITDQQGQTITLPLSDSDAVAIEQALWSSGEDLTIEQIATRMLAVLGRSSLRGSRGPLRLAVALQASPPPS